MSDPLTPPTPWWDQRECPREGCHERRYTDLGMAFHLVSDHEEREPPAVPDELRVEV